MNTRTTTRVSLLMLPLAALVVTLRLLQSTIIRAGHDVPATQLLISHGAIPVIVLAVCVPVYFLLRTLPQRPGPFISSAVATGLGVVLLLTARSMAPDYMVGWIDAEGLEVIRWDLLAVAGLTAALLLLGQWGSRAGRVAALGTAHLAMPIIATLAIASFAFFTATGTPVDATIVRYLMSEFRLVKELIRGSMEPIHVVALSAPWIWSAAVATFMAPRKRRELRHRPAAARVSVLVPVMLVLVAAPRTDVSPALTSGSLVGIALETASRSHGPYPPPDSMPDVDAEPFDIASIELTRTDSTRLPNIVIVLLESVRSRSTTPYNAALATTPFLDSLAASGALIERMYSVVSYTNKSLVPVLAGFYPMPGRQMTEANAGAIPARGLPTLLHPLGYRSAFFTSATMEFERKDLILENLGFQRIVGVEHLDTYGFDEKAYFGFEDMAMLQPAMRWVDEAERETGPFLLALLTLTAHHPYDVPDSYSRLGIPARDRELTNYYDAIRYTDDFLRALLTAFDERNLVSNTLFIFVGDHGEAFGEHGERVHGNVIWDEALEVPGILFWPGRLTPGLRIGGFRSHVDLVPTIADLLNVDVSGGRLPGTSVFDPVDGRAVFHQSLDHRHSLAHRLDSVKVIYRYHTVPTRAYNVIRDPYETTDISADLPRDYLSTVELDLALWQRRVIASYPADRWSADVNAEPSAQDGHGQ